MTRKILAAERSLLAKNVYSMLLSQLDEVEIVPCKQQDNIAEIGSVGEKTDLIIVSYGLIADRKDDFFREIRALFKRANVPCIIFVKKGSSFSEEGLKKLKGIEVVEKPFFPGDFVEIVRRLWGIK